MVRSWPRLRTYRSRRTFGRRRSETINQTSNNGGHWPARPSETADLRERQVDATSLRPQPTSLEATWVARCAALWRHTHLIIAQEQITIIYRFFCLSGLQLSQTWHEVSIFCADVFWMFLFYYLFIYCSIGVCISVLLYSLYTTRNSSMVWYTSV